MISRTGKQVAKMVSGGLLGILAVAPAYAQLTSAQGLIANPFVFSASGFIVSNDVKASLNGSSSTNPDVDFNDTFGTGSNATRFRLDGLWRITPRHHIRAMYFENSVTRTRTLNRDVMWDDITYNLGATVEAQTKVKVYELAYEYAFVHEPTWELAGSLGVHYTDMSLRLSGVGSINGVPGSAVQNKDSNLPAPLPVIGFRAGYAFAPDWYLDGLVQAFKIKINEYDGRWIDGRAGVTWMFTRNFGVGLAYNRFTTKVNVDKSNFNGDLKFGYSGLLLSLTGTF
ncbi:MAG TPA: hypothetical protein VH041_10385 [Caldimonas sp.]|nr:hypothetical protein [Caldimonas sp.]HEX4234705.1 hypothetical protein [Caldimonas sp.]